MQGDKRPTVILADDHRIVAEGLKSLLIEEFDLVAVVDNGRSLVEAVKEFHPNVVVADISMPHLNGIDAIARIKECDPRIAVVILTMHKDVVYARRALDAGALGYVLKHSAPFELRNAVRAALKGQTYLTPELAGKVLELMRNGSGQAMDPVSQLTPRQREILQLLAEGQSAKEVAAVLDVSPRTVEFHKYQMMEKLGIHTSAELVHWAIKQGLVPI